MTAQRRQDLGRFGQAAENQEAFALAEVGLRAQVGSRIGGCGGWLGRLPVTGQRLLPVAGGSLHLPAPEGNFRVGSGFDGRRRKPGVEHGLRLHGVRLRQQGAHEQQRAGAALLGHEVQVQEHAQLERGDGRQPAGQSPHPLVVECGGGRRDRRSVGHLRGGKKHGPGRRKDRS